MRNVVEVGIFGVEAGGAAASMVMVIRRRSGRCR